MLLGDTFDDKVQDVAWSDSGGCVEFSVALEQETDDV